MRAHGRGPQGEFTAQYHYDALGRRTRKTVCYKGKTPETTRFVWQGYRLLQEQRDNGTRRTWSYDPASPWTPLAAIEQAGDSPYADIYWLHTDLNSAPLEVAGAEQRSGPVYEQPLRYAGQYQDNESGLHYNLFRYYEPAVGRFTTQDPIGLAGGLNLYQYAPNPLTWIDPFGLTTCSPNKKTTYEGVSRRDAFRQAKRDAGIPMSQQPKSITRPDLLDGSGKKVLNGSGQPIKTRQYEFINNKGNPVFIQEHSLGHVKATPGHGAEPHFNVRPSSNLNTGSVPGTHGHYNFP